MFGLNYVDVGNMVAQELDLLAVFGIGATCIYGLNVKGNHVVFRLWKIVLTTDDEENLDTARKLSTKRTLNDILVIPTTTVNASAGTTVSTHR